MSMYYILVGGKEKPVRVEYWAKWFREHLRDRTVERVNLVVDEENVEVSTVFLGINHNFSLDGPPLIYETMIFGGKHDRMQWRYSTLKEAQEGHNAAMKYVSPIMER